MLAAVVDAYVAVRRAAGFTFRSEARQLASFAAFAEGRAALHVRASLAIEWTGLARSMPQRARRLGHVIRLARYLRAEDRDHEVPPAVFGAEKRSRPTPYILTPDQVRQLVLAASRSGYRTLRRETYIRARAWCLLAQTAGR
jgi:integrase